MLYGLSSSTRYNLYGKSADMRKGFDGKWGRTVIKKNKVSSLKFCDDFADVFLS
jgi:hypothetical protein